MENSDFDEPEKKRPHLNSLSPTMAPIILQYQNQRLLHQIDKQKHDLQEVEANIKELKDKQGSYDEMLITLVDDLILLGLCAGRSQNALQSLDGADCSRGSIPSCSAEEMFLCRLLLRDSIEANGNDEIAKYVEEALTLPHASTRELLKLLEHTIYSHREKTESIVHTLDGKISSEGELDDSMTELEESRRKLVNLKMQKDVASGMHNRTSGAVNGTHLKNQQKGQ
ncbi:PREDICTED: E3 ubiquitin-ligase [Prunus dulcis]|uniref:E3 ubiquitin protein ligase n=1 Tax=Prunus dulcis TaxID=3755 RepID=A0A5E4GGR3_PRUDU|nr:PREDICTED: E3 ubiquitin-ligase [Prunus dulcis]